MIVMPRRLSDEIASRVRALIEEQQLEAGMKLPAERQLAAQLGVSRNSLREALATLVNEGVLLSRRGGGTFVRWQHDDWSEQNIVQPLKTLMENDPDYSFDILEARHAIETSTAWHAAMRATEADKEKLGPALKRPKAATRISPRRRTSAFIWRLPRRRTTWCCCKPCAVSSTCCNPP
jgi:GntR family L-lactate dehydrogenase operon transcriptional regulator